MAIHRKPTVKFSDSRTLGRLPVRIYGEQSFLSGFATSSDQRTRSYFPQRLIGTFFRFTAVEIRLGRYLHPTQK
ncbi:Protein of unknown function [Pyronema omphalodes CBS 100304]|uniref:Uncharacterized protein n=1 Tax=Pyronema omphalodes (strain CBS 100304) TaxID=1076935 RepID=U4LDS6_PYROM|nr:Protein of unknown function [Pyronema omphalodes CBS 100304]